MDLRMEDEGNENDDYEKPFMNSDYARYDMMYAPKIALTDEI